MVSHCNVSSKRQEFVHELQKFIPVDIYGKCGSYVCGKRTDYTCFNMLERDYKFYLSFENSICEDYVTEKIWNPLKRLLIPVVMGGAYYAKRLPPNSYIDVANFTSPKALADYLRQVAADDDLYRSYFAWKRHYVIIQQHRMWCTMCEYLSTLNPSTSRTVKSFNTFWDKTKYCKSAQQYFKEFIQSPSPLLNFK